MNQRWILQLICGSILALPVVGRVAEAQTQTQTLTQAQPQALEPGVQTSSAAAPAGAGRADDTGSHGNAPATAPATAARAAPKGGAHVPDRLQLNTSEITGNRELPRVMYVVPWRRPDPGDFAGRPPNSLLDEALAPVDRDVFRRQNRYYAALNGATPPGNQALPESRTPGSSAAESPASRSQDGSAAAAAAGPTAKDEK